MKLASWRLWLRILLCLYKYEEEFKDVGKAEENQIIDLIMVMKKS